MRSFKLFLCFLTVLAMGTTFNLFADATVDNFEGGTNQNMFGFYWYFYDDHTDGGNSSIPGVTKNADGTYVVAPTAAAGHTGAGLVLPYILGPTEAGTPPSYNFIGMGTMLCANGKTIDLSSAKSITFWLKSTKAISIDFQLVDTVNIKDYAYFYSTCTIPAGTWTQFVISLTSGGLGGGLAQYSWTKNPLVPLATSLKTISKLQWQIALTGVGTNTSGTVTIDDISIQGYTFVPSDLCATCVGAPGQTPSPAALLSNMDTQPYNRNARGYYWYSYSDGVGRNVPASQFSAITGGATINPIDPTLSTILIGPNVANPALSWVKGYNGTNGADIQFTLGQSYTATGSTDVIKPFVGVGTELWNETTTSDVYNGATDGVNGVYFDYMLSGADTTMVLRLEVYANVYSISGEVNYIDLPYTGTGIWKGASVPFSKLTLPTWTGVVPTALDATILKKLQWAVQSTPGDMGEISIDNVYLLGATKITSLSNAIKLQNNSVKEMSGISTSMVNSNLKVKLPQGMSNASVSLVNTMGSVVARSVSGVDQIAHINVAGLASGVYMLNVKATKSGNEFNQTMPVTIY